MLTRSEVRRPLCLLLTLTLLAFLCCLVGLVLIAGKRLMGFMMTRGTGTNCNTYTNLKYQTYNIELYDTAFGSLTAGTLAHAVVLFQLFYLLIKYCQQEQECYIEEWTPAVYVRLYVMYSVAVIAVGCSAGKYFGINLEQNYKCEGHRDLDIIAITTIIWIGLLASLISLVLVFVWHIENSNRIERTLFTPQFIITERERETPIAEPQKQQGYQEQQGQELPQKKSKKKKKKQRRKKKDELNSLRSSEREEKIYLQYFEELQRSYMQSTPRG